MLALHLRVEPIRLGPPVIARYSDARRMDYPSFDAASPQPASEPETVSTGLEGEGDPCDPSASPLRLGLPTKHKAIQRRLVCLQLLQRLSLDPRYQAGNKPALETHFDDANQRAVLIKGGAGRAHVFQLGHGALHHLFPADEGATHLRRAPHSFCYHPLFAFNQFGDVEF